MEREEEKGRVDINSWPIDGLAQGGVQPTYWKLFLEFKTLIIAPREIQKKTHAILTKKRKVHSFESNLAGINQNGQELII